MDSRQTRWGCKWAFSISLFGSQNILKALRKIWAHQHFCVCCTSPLVSTEIHKHTLADRGLVILVAFPQSFLSARSGLYFVDGSIVRFKAPCFWAQTCCCSQTRTRAYSGAAVARFDIMTVEVCQLGRENNHFWLVARMQRELLLRAQRAKLHWWSRQEAFRATGCLNSTQTTFLTMLTNDQWITWPSRANSAHKLPPTLTPSSGIVSCLMIAAAVAVQLNRLRLRRRRTRTRQVERQTEKFEVVFVIVAEQSRVCQRVDVAAAAAEVHLKLETKLKLKRVNGSES